MREPRPSPIESQGGAAVFATTHWSLVLRAASTHSPEASLALETLCRTYWPPLYAYVRRKGHSTHEAQDLVQEFISRLLAREDLAKVSQDRGKFRSFLLASMNHFLANEWDRSQSQKRGGGKTVFSLDQALEEGNPWGEPSSSQTPEREYERRWAETVIARTLTRLRAEWELRYQARHFDDLKGYLMDARGTTPFSEAAARLGITESALKSVVHRLRKRYRELFREEIAQTVEDASEVDGEIRHLLAALGD